ncbi:unnamed protein product [Paramecium primaurelia]|uniref:Uncharacterized protein n=1 Tax=Paramecium primaurelia TaxID=5886 RepID=A0A8S1PHB1_PARPR|nr:unnamed protein product [Paramecium primaurelia]
MQQAFNLPQQQIVPFSNTTNRSQRSNSPNQRILQNYRDSSYDQRSQVSNKQFGEIEILKQKVIQLQKENEKLQNQLDKAKQKIKQLENTENEQINQSIFKTTKFELVVLQKVVEQLQQLKLAFYKQQNEQNIQSEKALEKQNQEVTLIVNSEFKSKVSMESLDREKESSNLQENIQQFEQGSKIIESKKAQTSDISEARQLNNSISYIQQKGCGSNAYRSVK